MEEFVGGFASSIETLQYIGVVHYLLDERQKALDIFHQELQGWRAEGDDPQQAQALNNSGVAYIALGLEQKAIESYQQALPLRRAAGDRAGVATTLDNIGLFYLNAGELPKALDPRPAHSKERRGLSATRNS